MASFPLLCLPALALAEIIAKMDLLEIFSLHKSSLRTSNRMKRFTKHILIILKVQHHNLNDKHVEFCRTEGQEEDYIWNPELEKFENIIDFFATNFKIEIISFLFENLNPETAYNVLQNANNLGLKLNSVNWKLQNCDEDVAKNVLKLCCNASSLAFCSHFEQLDFNEFRMFSMNILSISKGSWVTVDQIRSMTNVTSLAVSDSSLSNRELNTILKEWVSCNLNFQSLHLNMKTKPLNRTNIDAILDEVGVQVKVRDAVYFVRRADGSRGRIVYAVFYIRFDIRE